jgi:hypothetical protein
MSKLKTKIHLLQSYVSTRFFCFRRFWRRFGALIILCLIPVALFIDIKVYGIVIGMMITVPCGIKAVNKNWYLWYPRQLYFLVLSLLAIFG